jgi:hypothetical protein
MSVEQQIIIGLLGIVGTLSGALVWVVKRRRGDTNPLDSNGPGTIRYRLHFLEGSEKSHLGLIEHLLKEKDRQQREIDEASKKSDEEHVRMWREISDNSRRIERIMGMISRGKLGENGDN